MEFNVSISDLLYAVGLRESDVPFLIRLNTTDCSKEEVCAEFNTTLKVVKTACERFSKFCHILSVDKKDGIKLLTGTKIEYKPRGQMLKHKIKTLESANKKLSEALIEKQIYIDDVVEAVMSEIGYLDPVPFKYEPSFSNTPETAILNLSDWQTGSSWSANETGYGAFNNEELARRVERLTQKTISIVEMHRTTRDVPNLVCNLLGDFIENELIWPSQGVHIQECASQQMITCLGLMEKMFSTLLETFGTITSYCVSGNHGRMSHKKNEQHNWNNWDRLMYMFLAERFKNEERIKFYISDTSQLGYILPEAPNYNHIILHGDGINSSLGIPFYGINRALTKLSDMNDRVIHFAYLGHFHTPAQLARQAGRTFINGALCDTSPGAVDWLLSGRPSQTLLGFHPKRGVSWTYDISVADYKPREVDSEGLFTPYRTGV